MLSPLIILSPSILITDLPPITYLSLTWLHPHEFFSTTSSPSTAAVNDTDSRFEPQSSVCFPSPFCRVCSPPLLVKLPLSIPKLHSRSYLSLKLPRASLPKESIQPLKTGAATIPLPQRSLSAYRLSLIWFSACSLLAMKLHQFHSSSYLLRARLSSSYATIKGRAQ